VVVLAATIAEPPSAGGPQVIANDDSSEEENVYTKDPNELRAQLQMWQEKARDLEKLQAEMAAQREARRGVRELHRQIRAEKERAAAFYQAMQAQYSEGSQDLDAAQGPQHPSGHRVGPERDPSPRGVSSGPLDRLSLLTEEAQLMPWPVGYKPVVLPR
jgi:hypothetical protein